MASFALPDFGAVSPEACPWPVGAGVCVIYAQSSGESCALLLTAFVFPLLADWDAPWRVTCNSLWSSLGVFHSTLDVISGFRGPDSVGADRSYYRVRQQTATRI